MIAPTVETERLIMRAYTLADLPRFTELWSEEGFIGPMGAMAHDAEQGACRLLRYVGHWQLRGFGTWGIEEKASGRLIGEVGLFDYAREQPAEFAGGHEHGWAFDPDTHGQGYATEATRAALVWGAKNIEGFRPYCIIAESNTPSQRVAARIGYREKFRTIWRGAPTIFSTLG